jgi:hypothetical protein
MVGIMTQEVKDRIRDLERQKIQLEEELQWMENANNFVKMVKLEQEIYEIEDTISKLTA